MMRIMRNILLYVILYFISSITLVSHSAYLRRDYKKKLSGEIQYRNNNGIFVIHLCLQNFRGSTTIESSNLSNPVSALGCYHCNLL